LALKIYFGTVRPQNHCAFVAGDVIGAFMFQGFKPVPSTDLPLPVPSDRMYLAYTTAGDSDKGWSLWRCPGWLPLLAASRSTAVAYDGMAIGTGSHNMERHLSIAVFIFESTKFAA